MSRVKQASKQKRTTKAAAAKVLGAAGLSFSLAGSASASAVPAADIPQSGNTSPNQRFVLSEEEMVDVSLATFHVFDRENVGRGVQLARGGCGGCGHGGGGCGHGGGGCGGCRGGGGCGGCRGGGGCRGCAGGFVGGLVGGLVGGFIACRGCGGGYYGYDDGYVYDGYGYGGYGYSGYGYGGGCCGSWGACRLC